MNEINPSIIIEGLLVPAPAERIRILAEPYCLDFALADLLDVIELPAKEGLVAGQAVAARVMLRSGARLLQMASAEPYRHVAWTYRRPFAIRARIGSASDLPGDFAFQAKNILSKLTGSALNLDSQIVRSMPRALTAAELAQVGGGEVITVTPSVSLGKGGGKTTSMKASFDDCQD